MVLVYSTFTLGCPPCKQGFGNEPPGTGSSLTASAQTGAGFMQVQSKTKLDKAEKNQLPCFSEDAAMLNLDRITFNPSVMGGKPCLRDLRVTVGTLVGLIAAGHSHEEILRLYPYLEERDIEQALSYAAWRVDEMDTQLIPA
jgi:uncharacterized protein (DUF433 family)